MNLSRTGPQATGFGTKAGEHTAQALRPIAGPKGLSPVGRSLDDEFPEFAGVARIRVGHVDEMSSARRE